MCDKFVFGITAAVLLWSCAAFLLVVSALMPWMFRADAATGGTMKFGMVEQERMNSMTPSPAAFLAVWHTLYWTLLAASAVTGALTAARLYLQQRGRTRPLLLHLLPGLCGAFTLVTALVFVSLNEGLRGLLLSGSLSSPFGPSPVVYIETADAYAVMWTAVSFMPLAFTLDILTWRALLKQRVAKQRDGEEQQDVDQEDEADKDERPQLQA